MSHQVDSEVADYYRASRSRPQKVPDGERVSARADKYGGAVVRIADLRGFCDLDEGSTHVLTTPTPGTGIATIAAQASLADTAPLILGKNSNTIESRLRMYPELLILRCTAPGTAGAAVKWAVKVDAAGANRYTSGSGLAAAPQAGINLNLDDEDSRDGKIDWYAGAVVAAAANGAKMMGHGEFRPVIPVIGDKYYIFFGSSEVAPNSLAVAGTAIANASDFCSEVVVGPQQWFQFNMWLPSQSAASSWEILALKYKVK